MEEPNKKPPQDPDTQDETTHSPLLYKLMKEDAQAEIRVLKMKYASVLRNCIMSRSEKVLTTIKNVAAKHLDLDEIVLSLMDDDSDDDDHDDDDDDSDDKVEEKEEERIVRNKSKGIVINDPSETAQGKAPMVVGTTENYKGKAPMIYDTSEKRKGKAPMIYSTSEKCKGNAPMIYGTSDNSNGKEPMIVGSTENSKGKEAEIDGTRDKSKGKEPTIDGSSDITKGKETEIVGTSDKSKGKESMLDGSSDKSKDKEPVIYGTSDKSQGQASMIYGTSEKSEGKEQMILKDYSADKVLVKKPAKLAFKSGGIANIGYWYKKFSDEFASGKTSTGNTPVSSSLIETTSHAEEASEVLGLVEVGDSLKLGLGANWTETTSYTEEASDAPGLVEIRDSLKLGLRLNRTEAPSPEEMDVDDYETSESEEVFLKIENEDNLMSRKSNRDHKWENEEDMLLYLKTHRWLQLDAICALYRHERMIREQTTNRLAESNFHKITLLVEFLTNGIGHGPRVRTLNELEEIYRGSTALGSWLVVTYANQLYSIFCNKSDLYFC